jgi:hypothetical protein
MLIGASPKKLALDSIMDVGDDEDVWSTFRKSYLALRRQPEAEE